MLVCALPFVPTSSPRVTERARESWSFDFVERPNEELFHCEGSVENVSRFPARMGFTACSNPAVIFQFHHYENVGVYRLSISDLRDEKSSVYAYQIWRGDEFPVLWDEVGSYQVYAGPKEFVVPATL